jgi:hypothetical protein
MSDQDYLIPPPTPPEPTQPALHPGERKLVMAALGISLIAAAFAGWAAYEARQARFDNSTAAKESTDLIKSTQAPFLRAVLYKRKGSYVAVIENVSSTVALNIRYSITIDLTNDRQDLKPQSFLERLSSTSIIQLTPMLQPAKEAILFQFPPGEFTRNGITNRVMGRLIFDDTVGQIHDVPYCIPFDNYDESCNSINFLQFREK